MSKHPYPPYQCCVTPWTFNTLHTTLNGGKGGLLCLLLMWESNFAQSVSSAPTLLTRIQSWSQILGALSRNSMTFTSFLITIYILVHFMQNVMSKHPYPPYQCCVTPWTYNTLHTTLNGGKGGLLCLLLMWESNFAQSVSSAPTLLTRIVDMILDEHLHWPQFAL
jgi:hypothetical protein